MNFPRIFRHNRTYNHIEFLTVLTIVISNILSSSLALLIVDMNRSITVLPSQLINILVSFFFLYILYKSGTSRKLVLGVVGFYYAMAIGMWLSLSFAHHMAMTYYMNIVMCTIILLRGKVRSYAVAYQTSLAMILSYIDLNHRTDLLLKTALDTKGLLGVFIVCISMMLILFIHISAYSKAMAKINKHAVTDQLTKVGNRFAFINELHRMEDGFREEDRDFSLVFIDINDFKKINDTHGHAVGDMVLREFAGAIGRHTRDRDRFYRTGGDEFVLLLHGMAFNEARHRMIEICENLKHEKSLTFPVHFAYGISSRSRSSDKSSGLLEHADRMMYKAKIKYRNIQNLPNADALFGIGCIGSMGDDSGQGI